MQSCQNVSRPDCKPAEPYRSPDPRRDDNGVLGRHLVSAVLQHRCQMLTWRLPLSYKIVGRCADKSVKGEWHKREQLHIPGGLLEMRASRTGTLQTPHFRLPCHRVYAQPGRPCCFAAPRASRRCQHEVKSHQNSTYRVQPRQTFGL